MSYYYLNTEQQPVGPMEIEMISKLVKAGVIDPAVLVCAAGSEEWKPLEHFNSTGTEIAVPPLVPPPPRNAGRLPVNGGFNKWFTVPYPEWFPLVSISAGILSILLFGLPALALLLSAVALFAGILILKRPGEPGRGFALAGVITASLGLFAVILGFFGILSGGSEVTSMEHALSEGINISREARKRFPNDSVRQAQFLTTELQKVDTRNCPPEFRIAFQHNVDAWEVAIPYFESNNPAAWFLEGLFGGLANDYSNVGLTDYQARLAAQNIDDRYRELKSIAVAYGARIPTR